MWWAWPPVGYPDLWRGWCLGECPSPTPCPPVPIRHRPPPPTNPPNMATPWESTWLSRRTAAVTEQGAKTDVNKQTNKHKKKQKPYQLNHPTVRLTSAIWTYQQTACRATFHTFSFCMKPLSPEWGQWMSCHTEMGLTVKLMRRRSETSPPPYLFLFFVDLRDILVFLFIFEYILGGIPPDFWDTLTFPRAGRKSNPRSLL